MLVHVALPDELRPALATLDRTGGPPGALWDPSGWLGSLGPSRDVAVASLPSDRTDESLGTLAVWGSADADAPPPTSDWCERARNHLPAIVRQLGRVLVQREEADAYGLRLQASIGSLVGAETVRAVARSIIDHGVGATCAASGVLYELGDDGVTLRPAESYLATGEPANVRQRLRTGMPIFIATGDELTRRFPAFDQIDAGARVVAVAALPLKVHARAFGSLVFAFTAAHPFDLDERAFLVALAQQCELALERVRLSAEARTAREAKSDFMAVMSHELRTPLNAILGHAELIVDGIVGPVSELQRMHLKRLQRSGRELLGLVEEVLTLTKVETGADTAVAQPVDLGALVRETVRTLEPVAAARGIRLRALVTTASDIVETDVEKARHIVSHLVSNAIKFTERGEVTIALFGDSDGVECEVRDTGIGIAGDNFEDIFEPFWQVERPHTRRAGGMGLGLHITRRFARLLGGDVRVESRLGEGSTFTLRLPRHHGTRRTNGDVERQTEVARESPRRIDRRRDDPPPQQQLRPH